jgi:hypothetical protein
VRKSQTSNNERKEKMNTRTLTQKIEGTCECQKKESYMYKEKGKVEIRNTRTSIYCTQGRVNDMK